MRNVQDEIDAQTDKNHKRKRLQGAQCAAGLHEESNNAQQDTKDAPGRHGSQTGAASEDQRSEERTGHRKRAGVDRAVDELDLHKCAHPHGRALEACVQADVLRRLGVDLRHQLLPAVVLALEDLTGRLPLCSGQHNDLVPPHVANSVVPELLPPPEVIHLPCGEAFQENVGRVDRPTQIPLTAPLSVLTHGTLDFLAWMYHRRSLRV
mmetsp:Transcript_31702/g.75255  ORF Transcript_31702/g.75255 Transcript_31702/m.75255 type:complete len:208 (+) Transcript_31702:737-1360(+)